MLRFVRMRLFLEESMQILYRVSVSRQGFPGTSPSETDGKVSTLSILEHLGILEPSPVDLGYENTLVESQSTGHLLIRP